MQCYSALPGREIEFAARAWTGEWLLVSVCSNSDLVLLSTWLMVFTAFIHYSVTLLKLPFKRSGTFRKVSTPPFCPLSKRRAQWQVKMCKNLISFTQLSTAVEPLRRWFSPFTEDEMQKCDQTKFILVDTFVRKVKGTTICHKFDLHKMYKYYLIIDCGTKLYVYSFQLQDELTAKQSSLLRFVLGESSGDMTACSYNINDGTPFSRPECNLSTHVQNNHHFLIKL